MTRSHDELLSIDWNSDKLPTLPSVAHKLIEMAGKDDNSAAELAELIGQDPTLSLKVLQAANSAFYALRIEVTSIKHAIVLLGMQEVRRIAIGSVLSEKFLSVSPEAKPQAVALWRHLLATAVIGQDLSRSDFDEPDLYTLGLLHDLGWLVLLSEAPAVFKSMAQEETRTRKEAEIQWGVDHQIWGAKLAERWGMPEPFQVVNLLHHEPLRDTHPPEYLLATSLANHLAGTMGIQVLNAPVEPVPEGVLKGLGLDLETLKEMEKAVHAERDRIDALWKIMVG